MRIGVIADDFTGASDIAGFLVAGGLKTIMYNGVPTELPPASIEAVVISLKIRSCPVEEACSEALASLSFLRQVGCTKVYYKYCSTFDSTREGNIGPVVDALMDALGTDLTIICPSLPVNGRTVCHGYLFVGSSLLSDSPMRHHPITPMRDSKLERLMEGQFRGSVGHIYYPVLAQGSDAVHSELERIREGGHRYAVVDTLTEGDLDTIAEATEEMVLVTGGSGLAIGICNVLNRGKEISPSDGAAFVPSVQPAVIISGSCSAQTNAQVAHYKPLAPSRMIEEAAALKSPANHAQELSKWVLANSSGPLAPLLYATKSPEELEASRRLHGDSDVASAIEEVVALIVHHLFDGGIRTFISAGGETSGVVATTLALEAYLIGPQIDPGVSWLKALDSTLQCSFKSGNFGSVDFFEKAQAMCSKEAHDA
jgi:uncharacterized protein YgbK (DUF1537 family)